MKKKILFLSVAVVLLIALIVFIQSGDICYSKAWCRGFWGFFNIAGEILFTFVPVFFFSLITYKMRDEVFQAWWRFARWFVPVIIVVTFLQNIAHQQSGFGGVAQGAFDFLVQIILYTVFVVVSLGKIIYTHRKLKNK